jgi:chitinase
MNWEWIYNKYTKAAVIAVLMLAGAAIGFPASPPAGTGGTISSQASGLSSVPGSSAPGGSSAGGASSSVGSSSGGSSSSAAGSSSGGSSAASSQGGAPPGFTHPARMLTAYYASWAAYSGYTPDKIKATGLNVLNYAFAVVGPDNKVAAGDPDIDPSNFTKLRALRTTYPSLKIVISIGGWDDSARFSDAALTPASRSAFAESAVSFLKTYGFDGIDIDWEYPTGGGKSGNTHRSSDPENFRLLLKALRTSLDTQGAKDGKHYILSFVGGSGAQYANGIDLSSVAQTVDYGFIMTYDLQGPWCSYTDFNAALAPSSGTSPQEKSSVDSSVRSWLNAGFPSGKLIMGVPFYGYAYQNVSDANSGLWQKFSSGSAVGYDTIRSKYLSNSSFKSFYNSAAQVPWLFGGSVFVSYDDASSIRAKAGFAVSKGLLGVGAWELSFDRTAVLLDTARRALG